jgi:hypothetical protein
LPGVRWDLREIGSDNLHPVFAKLVDGGGKPIDFQVASGIQVNPDDSGTRATNITRVMILSKRSSTR